MKKLLFAFLLFAASAHAAPILFFCDLVSGPKTGGENNKGVYVTCYGEGFGGTRGASTVTIGGGAADNYPFWGTTYLWYQKLAFQLGANAVTGNIVVNVGGSASNGIAFTVRSGNIYFVDINTGNNANAGTVGSPFADAWWCKNHVAQGDTCYLRSGTWSTVEPSGGDADHGVGDGVSLLYMAGVNCVQANPCAMLAYPGDAPIFAADKSGGQSFNIRTSTGTAHYWTFAQIKLSSTFGTQYNIAWENTYGGDGLRIIGNEIVGSSATAIVMQGNMDGNYILGNNIHTMWDLEHGANRGERGYSIYYGGYGVQQNIQVKWNRFNQDQGDCQGAVDTSAANVTWGVGCNFTGLVPGQRIIINTTNYAVSSVTDSTHLVLAASAGSQTNVLYISGGNGGTKGIDAYGHLSGDLVKSWDWSNNEFYNFCREAILAGGSDGGTPIIPDTGTQLISNNLFVHNGICDADYGYSAVTVQSGYIQMYNNVFYHNGNSPKSSPTCDIDNQSVTSLVVSNNTFTAPADTTYYTGYVCVEGGGDTAQISGNTNSFTGYGSGPAYLTGNINATDPLFVSPTEVATTGDFHLQSGSPVKTGGTTLAAASPDKDGCTRPQGATYGLGAYEYPATCSAGGGGGGTTYYFRGHQ